MLWAAVALAAPDLGFGFESEAGEVLLDALGAAHMCLAEGVARDDGRDGGGGLSFLRLGALQLSISEVDPVTLGLALRADGDGVVVASGDLVLAVRGGPVVVEGLSTLDAGSVDDGAWHHVAVGTGSGVVKVFVDGTEVASGPADGALGEQLWIGGTDPYGGDGWRGGLDDLTLTRAFPDAAVVAEAASVTGAPSEELDCVDYDGDGLLDRTEDDLGTDSEALDSDGDTFTDRAEQPDPSILRDTDGDGVIDALDDDDDGDGIPSLVERVADGTGDGAPDLDLDGDGLDNGVDLDSDGDGLLDVDEGTGDSDGDGIADFMDAVDDPPTGSTDGGPGGGPASEAGASKDDDGCGCATAPRPTGLLVLLPLVGWRRRTARARGPAA